MSKNKIEKPKVFISYAWGTKEYQEKVLAFATQLMGDGVEVIIDKWDLSEGNDTYAFMEKCANDKSITNVLMLLDPIYAQKADSHKGGVGTETQIISPKVYAEVTQDKFIPIVFERNEKGEVCKPTYLQGRLHFDLSKDEGYDEEYSRLVKFLYGEETYKKPELGNKPAWIEKSSTVEVKRRNTFDVLKTAQPEKARVALFAKNVSDVLGRIKTIAADQNGIGDYNDVLDFYKRFDDVKKEYLALLEYTIFVNGAEKSVAKHLEKTASDIHNITSASGGLAKTFLHELFLYTVAFYLKNDDFLATGNLLSHPYYNVGGYPDKISGYDVFYSGSYDSLDRAMKERDNKNYICGTAAYWVENIDENYSKEQLVFADLICFNYSIYGKDRTSSWYHWFPLTYIYDNEFNSCIGTFARRLISKQFVEDILPLFGYENIDSFKQRMEEVKEEIDQRRYQDIRFRGAWNIPGMLNSFVEPEKVATSR